MMSFFGAFAFCVVHRDVIAGQHYGGLSETYIVLLGTFVPAILLTLAGLAFFIFSLLIHCGQPLRGANGNQPKTNERRAV